MAPIIVNCFDQINPSGNGQYHNTLILSTLDFNTLVFNKITYPCVWSCTTDDDGQWRHITVSFSRKQRVPWSVETYVRVGTDVFILQSRLPAIPNDHLSEDGTFYDVPLKVLRVLASSRTHVRPSPPVRNYLHLGPGATCSEYYWQDTYASHTSIVEYPMVAIADGEDENPMPDHTVVNSE